MPSKSLDISFAFHEFILSINHKIHSHPSQFILLNHIKCCYLYQQIPISFTYSSYIYTYIHMRIRQWILITRKPSNFPPTYKMVCYSKNIQKCSKLQKKTVYISTIYWKHPHMRLLVVGKFLNHEKLFQIYILRRRFPSRTREYHAVFKLPT